MNPAIARVVTTLTLGSLLVACAGNPWLSAGKQQLEEGNTDAAFIYLQQSLREYPDDREARALFLRQRDVMVRQGLADAEAARVAGNVEYAEQNYQRVLKIDPGNLRANEGLAQLAAGTKRAGALEEADALLRKGDTAAAQARLRAILAQSPGNAEVRAALKRVQAQIAQAEAPTHTLKGPFLQPITLQFQDAPLRSIFEVISRTTGINFVFDKDVKADARATVFVRNTSIDEVIRLILVTNQLERKLLNANSLLIYPNLPAKIKDYQELEVRSFFLANADVKQAMALIKTMVKSHDVFVDEKLNLLVVRDTPDALRLAEGLLESLDLAEPEVMLEVEVMEISRGRLTELGLRFPDQIGYGMLQSSINTSTVVNGTVINTVQPGGTLAPGYVDLRQQGGLTTYVSNPALVLNLRNEDGDSNLLANPRIRVKNREKAKIHIGDKLPVFITTSTANVGVSASISYLDVGLKLEVEPTVYLQDEVGIKVGLEVSSVSKEIPGPANSLAYQIGTRSAATTLRLKDGETQVLAGLISDEERGSAAKLPGLGDIPLLGRLFSSHRDSHSKTEIVLLITPRILRNLAQPASAGINLPSGTDAAIGARPLRLNAAAPLSPDRPEAVRPGPVSPAPNVATELPPPGVPVAAPAPDSKSPEPSAPPSASVQLSAPVLTPLPQNPPRAQDGQ